MPLTATSTSSIHDITVDSVRRVSGVGFDPEFHRPIVFDTRLMMGEMPPLDRAINSEAFLRHGVACTSHRVACTNSRTSNMLEGFT
jgi:hypothetical protein